MPQVINEPSLGGNIGAGLGSGLNQGLQSLVQNLITNKQQQQQRQNTISGLQALGISPQDASQLQGLPESLQSIVLKNYLGSAGNTGLDQVLSAIRGEPVASQGATLSNLLGIFPQQEPQSSELANLLGGVPQQQNISSETPDLAPIPLPPGKTLQEALRNPRITPDQRLKIEKMIQQREQHSEKQSLAERKFNAEQERIRSHDSRVEQAKIDKETLPIYQENIKLAKNADENNKRLDRMEKILAKGNLGTPIFNATIKKLSKGIFGFGIDLSSLMTADAQEFEKLSAQFASGAKEVFPGRVTNLDLESYMKQIPNLSQSAAGIQRIINSMRTANKAALLRKDTMIQLINVSR
ncbi:hypothetical protein [Candidatus Babela massiliensis]|uniref:Uncharacterized protein n=1 Tax=Candidatus Babela massiliensis TaxID=673862 RepID=V6DJZ0_9BACT|nr:hypothetical protein [Candidatus Babela massiliensis]CDK30836.1 hypothetical protein BABL1_gene_178 [Candidatus Babela massiliensis]